MQIPYVDLTIQSKGLKEQILEAVSEVLESGSFVLGEAVEAFEKEFAKLCETKYAIGVNSGTDALILSLRALGVGPGDEVITAPNSFVATASAIALVGARPVFADVREDYTLDPEQVIEKITPKTKGIIPVHLTGQPADMGRFRKICEERDLILIEDAAQAVMASWDGHPVGGLSHAGCFSLHPLKTLNACGDGGVVVTNDKELADQLRLLRNLGLESRSNAVLWSSNSRLDAMQAAILRVKLPFLEEWTLGRQQRAQRYAEALADLSQVKCPSCPPLATPVYHTFVIEAERRDQLAHHLQAHGIGTAIHYPIPIHLQQVGQDLGYQKGDFPEAERQADRILSLPIYPELSDQERVIEQIYNFYRG